MTYDLICPACGATVPVEFGNRSDDGSVLTWRHDGCPDADQYRRVTDYFVTSLPTAPDS